MNEQNTKHLFDTYPILYRDREAPISESLVAFGFEYQDGWFKLTEDLSKQYELLNNSPDCPYYIIAVQMKEKFGTLRFYIHLERKDDERFIQDSDDIWRDIIWELESRAESISSWTCEKCGKYGEQRTGGWIVTLCDTCYEERKKPKEE